MPAEGTKLDRRAVDIVVRIARRQLRAVDAACTRLAHGAHDEALHDLRVALRRLRSTLRAYAPQLDGAIRPKDHRRLKRLARVTSDARDAEVQIERLRTLRDDLGPDEQAVAAFLLRRLRRRMRDGYATARAEMATRHPRTTRALEHRLRRIDPSASLPFRLVIAPLVAAHIADLRPLLEHAPAADDVAALHQARIEVKRVRYLLEPVRRVLPGSPTALQRLERLQDLLGTFHDFACLEETIRTARSTPAMRRAVPLLARLVRERRHRLHGELARAWLGEQADVVLAPLHAVAERLGGTRRPALPARVARARSKAVVRTPGRW